MTNNVSVKHDVEKNGKKSRKDEKFGKQKNNDVKNPAAPAGKTCFAVEKEWISFSGRYFRGILFA